MADAETVPAETVPADTVPADTDHPEPEGSTDGSALVLSEERDRSSADRIDNLRAFYLLLADSEFKDYCPLYEQLAKDLAADDQVLESLEPLQQRVRMLPILLFACMHYLVLEPETQSSGPGRSPEALAALAELSSIYSAGSGDAWPAFRAVLDECFEELADLATTRTVQTNEVGRSAIILPALAAVHDRFGLPMHLIDVGASAGLNLYLDRFRIDYSDGRSTGDADAPVKLQCEVLGDLVPPMTAEPLPIVAREGIDLSPVDIMIDGERRWLEACLWPGLTSRRERLDGAIEIARSDPPTIHAGNAIEALGDVLGRLGDDEMPCLTATWVLAYFTEEDRSRLKDLLGDFGRDRPVAFVTGEYPGIPDWVPSPTVPAASNDPRAASVLGLTTWDAGRFESKPVAWMHAHGMWIHWLDESTAGRATAT